MPATPLNTILNWFETGDFPTQEQFAASWSSFYHKDEFIPMDKVENLNTKLQDKTDKTVYEAHLTNPDAHNTTLAKLDGSNLNDVNIQAWKAILQVGELPSNIALIDDIPNALQGNVWTKEQSHALYILLEDFVLNGKIRADKIEALGLTELIPVTQTSLAAFMANNANYTYEKNDMIAIPDGNGNYSLYIFRGGSKTTSGNYIATGLSNITIAMVQGLQAALDAKLDKPSGNGNFFVNRNGAATGYRIINPASNYLLLWNGTDFTGSDIYNNSGKYGIGTTSPSEMLHLNNGRVRSKAVVLDDNTEQLPGQITYYNRRFRGTDVSGVARDFMYRDFADMIGLWSIFTQSQLTEWKTIANGGWTTATMSIFLINPIVVDNSNNNKYVSLIGANLNLNPASFSVTIVDISGNTIAVVPNSQVNVSNTSGQNLIFYFNFSTIPAGTYKIKLWNGVATYTSGVTFRVATSVDHIDLSGITWNTLVYENLFNTDTIANNTLYAINAKTKDANGNAITYPGSGIFTTAGLSSALCTMNDNFVIEIGLFFNSDPALRDSLGGLAIDTVNSLANTLIAGARVQRGQFKTLGDVPVPGATLSNNQRIIFAKSENILTTVLYTSSGSISSITNVTVDNTPVKLKSIRGNYDAAPSSYNDALFNLQIINAYKF
ncbi:hypothetical protein CLU96_1932 [Chryseobacterium sp. 52]|uniref:hypothetical protein n=1 Tax=Chryseobacterium sp. 52 TaxID=2035213 RepID=UPI000C18D58A|nr:hypothetical protein [Chryseobacterium sp. 52]PIF44933.1 hypothetical protein CLU96_1932 [Chryseobacterium sp. 52]